MSSRDQFWVPFFLIFSLSTYGDDTQVFKSAETIDQVEHAINADLKKVEVWYEFNQTREIIKNIKESPLEGSREILC